MRLALALLLWPGLASADAAFLGPMLDSLGNPERDAGEIVQALEGAGFVVAGVKMIGPEALSGGQADPYYFHLEAFISPGAALAPDGKPEMVMTCSRIGQPTRAFIEKGGLISAVQTWSSVVDFALGAAAQLKCAVDLLPLTGTVLPTTDEVMAAVQPRFAESGMLAGTAPRPEDTAGWVVDPTPDPKPQGVPELQIGQTRIAGRNAVLSVPDKPDWIFYDHFQAEFMHSFVLTGHIALPGS